MGARCGKTTVGKSLQPLDEFSMLKIFILLETLPEATDPYTSDRSPWLASLHILISPSFIQTDRFAAAWH